MRHLDTRARTLRQYSDRPLMLPNPRLANERVVLRRWELADARHLVTAWTDPEIVQFSEVPESRDPVDAETWIAGAAKRRLRRHSIDLVIANAATGSLMGEVGFWNFNDASNGAMLSYWLLPAHRGRGNARAAVELACDWAMAPDGLALDLVVAKIDRDNEASESVVRSLGFRLERNDTDGHRLFTCRSEIPQIRATTAK